MKPARRLAKILLNAESASMDRTHVELARQIALLSRETGPFERLAIIDRHALAVNIKAAKRCLSGGITSLDQRLPLLARGAEIALLVRHPPGGEIRPCRRAPSHQRQNQRQRQPGARNKSLGAVFVWRISIW